MKSNGTQPVCKRGVCTAEKCFCPDNLIRKKYTWGEECISTDDLVDQNAQNKSFNGLYGVDVDGDIYYASYDLDNNIVENATSFGDKMPFRLGFITNLRYDFYDNSLIINDRYEGKLNTDPRKMILQFHLKNDPTNWSQKNGPIIWCQNFMPETLSQNVLLGNWPQNSISAKAFQPQGLAVANICHLRKISIDGVF